MRIAHGYGDSRMPEQLLDRHNIHASINEARRERVAQCMPGDIGNACLPARKSKACFQVNKRLAGFVVVEDTVILPAHCPGVENVSCFGVEWHGTHLSRFLSKDIQNAFLHVHG